MTATLTTTLLYSNLLAWMAQIAIIVAIGALAARTLSAGRARLIFWQVLLAAALLIPAVEPWQTPAHESPTTVAVTTSTSAFTAAPPANLTFAWRKEYVLSVIFAGAALRGLWILIGFARLRRHRLSARALAEPPVPFENLAIRWYVSDTISGPVTFGWLRPAILLPSRVCELPADLREAIACHELIHVRRGDWLFVLVEEAIRGLFWFHPAVWFALSQIQLSREQAVDAEVVGIMSNRERYLDALVAVAAQRLYPDVAPAPLFLKKRQLAVRVAAVLKETRMSKPRLVASFTTVCSAALVAARLAVWFFPLQSPVTVNAQSLQVTATAPPMDSAGIEVDAGGPLMHRTGIFRPMGVTATGTVVVDLSLSSKGEVMDARVVSGPDELRKYVLQSVLQWHYSTTGGAPPTVRASIKFGAAPDLQRTAPVGVQRVPTGTSPMAPARFQFHGVSQDLEQRVRARLPVHDGDQITTASLAGIMAAAHEVDEHFLGSIRFDKSEAVVSLVLGGMPQTGGVSGGVQGGIVAYRDGAPILANVDSAPNPQRIRVGGNVQQVNLIRRVNPVYPPLAKQARIQGVVHLTAIIGKDGAVQNLELISGHPLLAGAAMDAVKQWEYKPTLLNGQPVEVITQVDVNFTLSEEPQQ
jgi:TonB family protein